MKFTAKGICAFVLALALAFACAACQQQVVAPTPAPTASPAPGLQSPSPSPAAVDTPIASPELTPDVIAKLNAMEPIFDSLVRAMQSGGMMVSESVNPDFFWQTLFNLCTNFGGSVKGMESDGTQVKVPTAVMHELAAACFIDFEALPELPPQTFPITYNSDWDAYFVEPTDTGDTFTKTLGYEPKEAGGIDATVGYFAMDGLGNETLTTVYKLHLAPAETTAETPLFYYGVSFAETGFTTLAHITGTAEREGKRYATVDTMQAVILPAGTKDEAGIPYEADKLTVVDDQIPAKEYLIYDNASFSFDGLQDLQPEIDTEKAGIDPVLFFMEYAPKKDQQGEPLLFSVNIYKDVIYGGELTWEYYFG